MNTIGKKNMIFGFVYLVITVALGMFLANKLGSNNAEWINSGVRKVLKAAHAHGNLESVLNIIIGFLLCKYGSETRMLTRVASVLAIVGATFHSGMLFLSGLGVKAAYMLAPVGAISLLVAAILMVVILYKGVKEES